MIGFSKGLRDTETSDGDTTKLVTLAGRISGIYLFEEGKFTARNNQLGELMHSSKKALPWLDFYVVDKAREQRNKVAHQQARLPRSECWKYIDAMESELVAWSILSAPIGFTH